MGYTHYFAYSPRTDAFRAAWPQMVTDARRILNDVECDLVRLAGPLGNGAPEVSEHGIAFNGRRPYGHESFALSPMPPEYAADPYRAQQYTEHGFVWDFCKTGRKPYDIAVSAVLLRCHMLAPATFVIDSDGCWEDEGEWGTARLFVNDLFGACPDVSPFRDTTAGPELRDPRPPQHPVEKD